MIGEDFVLKLGRGLHMYGQPTHRLEEALVQVCRRLGIHGQFFSMPTALFASFGEGVAHRTFQIRVEPGGVDLGKLARLDELRARVAEGRLAPGEGSLAVDAILEAPPAYGPWLTTPAYALASATACRFFGGGWREIAAAGAIGLVIGLLALLLARQTATARVFEATAAATAAFIAVAASSLIPPLQPSIAILAGLIILVPGFAMTVAFTDLATRNLVSGTARLAGAAVSFLAIAFGVALGTRLAEEAFGHPAAIAPLAPPEWTLLVSLLIAPLAFAILFQADGRDLLWVVAGVFVAFVGGRLGARWLGPHLGAFVGAAAVSAFGNAYCRLVSRPASVPTVPGLLLLVPGSLGFQSVTSLLSRDALQGVEAAFAMILVAVSLATGLLVGNVILPMPRLDPGGEALESAAGAPGGTAR